MRVVVVIPAWNEEDTIGGVVVAARRHADVVVVDDGSSDHTAVRAAEAGAEVVRHFSNQGYDAALRSGFRWGAARDYDVIASIDGDAQHDPTLLGVLLSPLIGGRAELVLGVRQRGARFSERAFSFYTRRRFGVPDILCGMKAFSLSVYRAYPEAMSLNSIGTGLALAALRDGARLEVVAVPIRTREGETRFGSGLGSNLRIARALAAAIAADMRRPDKGRPTD